MVMLPFCMVMTLSAHSPSGSGSWEAMTIVVFISSLSWASIFRRRSRCVGSNPAKGSSRRMSSGFGAITEARATRCCSPKLRVSGSRSLRCEASQAASAERTRCSISSSGRRRHFGVKATSSRTVSSKSWRWGFWKSRDTVPSSSPALGVFLPHTVRLPVSGWMAPANILRRVDLPQPFSP